MCEICEALKEFDKASEDLGFRIKQHGHALRMGDDAEAVTASASAINALHRLLMAQKRMTNLILKLGDPKAAEDLLKGKSLH